MILISLALAGYGDPVGGFPSDAERALVLWTNAARVDPGAYTGDYREGGCGLDDFSADEKRAKAPLYIDVALTETGRHAHYVLPAPSQFEKWEATFFNFEAPANFFHLRQPVLPPMSGRVVDCLASRSTSAEAVHACSAPVPHART